MKNIINLIAFFFITTIAIAQNTILWSIKKPHSEKTSYIIGTFHQMGNSFIDEKPLIKNLIYQSDIAIFETVEDPNEKIVNVMLKRTDDYSYREYLNKEVVDFLENYTVDWKIPISKQKPAELLAKLQQEYVKLNCGTIKPTDTSAHMDNYLQTLAEKQNIYYLSDQYHQPQPLN